MSNKQNDEYEENLRELDNFFGFGESLRQFDKLITDLHPPLSNCCSAKVFGELFKNFGRCSQCLEMAEFKVYKKETK